MNKQKETWDECIDQLRQELDFGKQMHRDDELVRILGNLEDLARDLEVEEESQNKRWSVELSKIFKIRSSGEQFWDFYLRPNPREGFFGVAGQLIKNRQGKWFIKDELEIRKFLDKCFYFDTDFDLDEAFIEIKEELQHQLIKKSFDLSIPKI